MRWASVILLCMSLAADAAQGGAADATAEAAVQVLRTKCLGCHSTAKQEGEFDLERLCGDGRLGSAGDAAAWENVVEQVSLGQMPPADAPQLSAAERTALAGWIRGMLGTIARSQAGDPGPVVLRRLSKHEYAYSIRDLTGVDSLDPAREFPVDGAAGEGFTNAGAAPVMSPALLAKYLAAAKEIAAHAVFTPRGGRRAILRRTGRTRTWPRSGPSTGSTRSAVIPRRRWRRASRWTPARATAGCRWPGISTPCRTVAPRRA